MSVSFKHKLCGSGITVSEIQDSKFKSNSIVIRFITPLEEISAPKNALIVDLLSTSNSEFPSRELLTEALAELYGSSVNAFSYRAADYQICGLSINFIGDDYTIGKEAISEKAAEIILQCVFHPHFENGSFSEKYFKLRKQEILDMIEGTINNKRQYALLKAYQNIFEGEPASISTLGTAEIVEQIALDDLNAAYEKLLSDSTIDITICGGGSTEKAKELILDEFSRLGRKAGYVDTFLAASPLKSESRYTEERIDVLQCKMIMAFKTLNNNVYADKVMCAMLGGSPTSKLFVNVREKLSLCYYCSSGIIEAKNTMIIDSGLDEDKLEIAQSEIIRQLEALQNGDFTDEELENIKLYIIGAFRSNYDSIGDMNSWYFYQFVRGTGYSPDDVAEIISELSREDIINSAKGFELDTVFVLKPLDGGEKQ